MANMKTWFKFYGQEFLTDPKMLSLSALERSLWLTMLCLASSSSEEGVIDYIDEYKIKILTNLSPLDDEWSIVDGFLSRFEELGMIKTEDKKIIITNFNKRQETNLTNAERQQRYRDNNKSVTPSVTKVTLEKNREDKNRKDIKKEIVKKEKTHTSLESLIDEDFEKIAKTYNVPVSFVRSKYDDLVNWHGKNPRKNYYMNYYRGLMDWVKKDAIKIIEKSKGDPTKRGVDATNL